MIPVEEYITITPERITSFFKDGNRAPYQGRNVFLEQGEYVQEELFYFFRMMVQDVNKVVFQDKHGGYHLLSGEILGDVEEPFSKPFINHTKECAYDAGKIVDCIYTLQYIV
jgi:hypothetical protein